MLKAPKSLARLAMACGFDTDMFGPRTKGKVCPGWFPRSSRPDSRFRCLVIYLFTAM